MPDLPKLSKFLSRLLRHDADTVGLVLDEHGYTDLSEVWKLVEYRYPARYKLANLQQVVAGDATGKQRFELVDGRIRALYGHSTVRLITYEPVEPPELLYHGTSANAWAAIRANGLLRRARQYVHLTTRLDRATQVGSRHGGQTDHSDRSRCFRPPRRGAVLPSGNRSLSGRGHPRGLHQLSRLVPYPTCRPA